MSPRNQKSLITGPQRPDLPSELETVGVDAISSGDELEMVEIIGNGQVVIADTLEVTGCVIDGVTFTGTDFRAFEVRDVVLRGCDFSGIAFPERSRLLRTRFEGCRGSGMSMSGLKISDVEFVGGRFDLAMFRTSTLDRVFFTSAQAREIDFYGATLNSCGLLNSELQGMSLEQATLTRVALFGSTLDDLKGAERLSGSYVATDQLVPLAQVLADSIGIAVVASEVVAQTLSNAIS